MKKKNRSEIRKPEDLLPLDIVSLLNGGGLVNRDLYKHVVSEDFNVFIIGGSENHTVEAALVWLLYKPNKKLGQYNAKEWWIIYLKCQIGETENCPAEILKYHGGSEVRSNSYGGMTWNSILLVRLWALNNNHAELIRLTGIYNKLHVYFLSLFTIPSIPKNYQPARRAIGAGLLKVGGRSTNMHYTFDAEEFLYNQVLRWPKRRHPWIRDPDKHWYLESNKAPIHFVDDRKDSFIDGIINHQEDFYRTCFDKLLILGIKTFPEFHIMRWFGGDSLVISFMDKQPNSNTVSVMCSVYDYRTQIGTNLLPFKNVRGPMNGRAILLDDKIVANGEITLEYTLPERDCDQHISINKEGIQYIH